MGPLELDWTTLAMSLLFVTALTASVVPLYLRDRRRGPLQDILQHPDRWADELAGVVRIHVGTRVDVGADSSGFGEQVECFAILEDGGALDLARGPDPDAITRDAARLAERLGIPLTNDSTGYDHTGSAEARHPIAVAGKRRRRLAGVVCAVAGLGSLGGAGVLVDRSIDEYSGNWRAYREELERFPTERERLAEHKARERAPSPSSGDIAMERIERDPLPDILYEVTPPRPPDPATLGFGSLFLAGTGLLGLTFGLMFAIAGPASRPRRP